MSAMTIWPIFSACVIFARSALTFESMSAVSGLQAAGPLPSEPDEADEPLLAVLPPELPPELLPDELPLPLPPDVPWPFDVPLDPPPPPPSAVAACCGEEPHATAPANGSATRVAKTGAILRKLPARVARR
jgi:hypothetical protein